MSLPVARIAAGSLCDSRYSTRGNTSVRVTPHSYNKEESNVVLKSWTSQEGQMMGVGWRVFLVENQRRVSTSLAYPVSNKMSLSGGYSIKAAIQIMVRLKVLVCAPRGNLRPARSISNQSQCSLLTGEGDVAVCLTHHPTSASSRLKAHKFIFAPGGQFKTGTRALAR